MAMAQTYIPADTADYKQRLAFCEHYKESNKLFTKRIKDNYKRKIAIRIEENIESYSEKLIEEIMDSHFLFDERFTAKANKILDEFKSKNTEIPENTRIVVSKDPALNAFWFLYWLVGFFYNFIFKAFH